MDKLIDGVVIKRIEEAAAEKNTALLRQHLSDSYDIHVHRAVYRALGCVATGEAVALLMKAAIETDGGDSETERIITEALTDAFSAQCAAVG